MKRTKKEVLAELAAEREQIEKLLNRARGVVVEAEKQLKINDDLVILMSMTDSTELEVELRRMSAFSEGAGENDIN